jgi:hypothetical protein
VLKVLVKELQMKSFYCSGVHLKKTEIPVRNSASAQAMFVCNLLSF